MSMTDVTIAALKKAKDSGALSDTLLQRAWTVGSPGITAYDLDPVVYTLPQSESFAPFLTMVPRIKTNRGDTATRWRAIYDLNTANVAIGVEEGKRGGQLTLAKYDYTASFKTLGLENYITEEAIWAAGSATDAEAGMVRKLLLAFREEEENTMFGGNATLSLGTGGTPTIADVVTGGLIPDATDVYVRIVPLTHDGYRYTAGSVTALPGQVTRTNADGTTTVHGGFNGQVSVAATLTTSSPGTNVHSVTAYWANTTGAVAYAVYWGPDGTTNCVQGAIVTINSYVITAAAGTGQASNHANLASDYSTNDELYDGLGYIIAGDGPRTGASGPVGGVYAAMATGTIGTGTGLTADTAGGIVEIDTDLRAFWDDSRISPTHIFMNAQEILDITKKLVAGGGAPLVRLNMDAAAMVNNIQASTFSAGTVVGTYLNKFSSGGGQMIKLVLHPTCPPGMIMYYTKETMRNLPEIPNLLQLLTRQDYYQVNWPQTTRQKHVGVYMDGVLQCYYPSAFGIRRNIGTG